MHFPKVATAGVALLATLALAGCSTAEANPTPTDNPAEVTSVEVSDNNGTHVINLPLTSVVATDNRVFETLDSWGIELSAAAVALMPDTIGYKTNPAIVDLGSHNEPNLEVIVTVNPDLVINGQRFARYHDQIAELAPNAVVLNLDPREGEPLDQELKRQTTVLGEIFGKQAEAKQLVDDFDAAIARAKAAYDAADTVMAVNVSGGNIGYLAPGVGRTLGPVFALLDLTPALEVDGSSDDHQGDDIALEAIAASNPSWILVMDRDAAVSSASADYVPAAQVIENSEALARVTAVVEGNIIYMPADTYTNEGIQTYTEFLNAFADALEAR